MSDFLFGGFKTPPQQSGSPLETRGAIGDLAGILQQSFGRALDPKKALFQDLRSGAQQFGQSRISSPFQRMASELSLSTGFSPEQFNPALMRALIDPASQASALTRTLEPFEQRQTEQSVAGLRSGLGTLGGRFSRNALEAESQLRGELSNQFARNRAQAVMDAQGQQAQLLSQIIPAAMQTSLQAQLGPLSFLGSFLQPGAPQQAMFQQGAFGQLAPLAALPFLL